MELISTIEDLWQRYPDRINLIFHSLDNKNPFLKPLILLFTSNPIEACEKLLDYYQKNYDYSWVDYDAQNLPVDDEMKQIKDLDENIFTFQLISHKIPITDEGFLDWSCLGPNQDKEFGWALNRHHFLYLLVKHYTSDSDSFQNQKYVQKFNYLIQDWLISNPCPLKKTNSPQWRALEAALRSMWVWPFCFYGFLNSTEFSPATRILMLASLLDHVDYLQKYYVPKGNIRVMELNAIVTIATMWPEFQKSKDWIQFAINLLTPEILSIQVYPDGIQKELTSHYHRVALVNFEQAMNMARKAGMDVSSEYEKKVILMWNYLAYSIRPDGYGLLNNDSDRDDNKERLINAATLYQKEDWKYLLFNGLDGNAPDPISFVSPWAGQLISRSGVEKEALWSMFDFGPLGIGHIHRDKNHLSIAAFGHDFLVDSGRFRYIGDKWRRNYFTSTPAHNTIMVDNRPQKRFVAELKSPISSSDYEISTKYDFAIGTYREGYGYSLLGMLFGKITHSRAVIFLKSQNAWVVIDYVKKPKMREISNSKIQTLWHFHPDCQVEWDDQNLIAAKISGIGNLVLVPLHQSESYNLDLIKGQEFPQIQGWWSREYNHKEPSPCVVVTQLCKKSIINAWLICPIRDLSELGSTNPFRLDDFSFDFRELAGKLVFSLYGHSTTIFYDFSKGSEEKRIKIN